MTVYFVTGKLGGGKSLVAVKRMQEYHKQGRPVATNVDVDLVHLLGEKNDSARHIRVPDKPSADDLMALGHAYEGDYNEEKNGLVVLDELGSWLNSRTWNDKSRSGFIEWAIHARKFGWDVIFLVQHVEMVDVQIRNALCEYLVVCRRMDRLKIPGTNLRPPRVHVGTVYYSSTENAKMKVETWTYRGNDVFKAYDTRQAFSTVYDKGNYSVLPPAYIQDNTKEKKKQTKGGRVMKTTITLVAVFSVLGAVIFGMSQTYAKFSGKKPMFERAAVQEPVVKEEAGVGGLFGKLSGKKVVEEAGETEIYGEEGSGGNALSGYDYNGYIKTDGDTTILFTDAESGMIIHYTERELGLMGLEVVAIDIGVLVIDDEGELEVHRSR